MSGIENQTGKIGEAESDGEESLEITHGRAENNSSDSQIVRHPIQDDNTIIETIKKEIDSIPEDAVTDVPSSVSNRLSLIKQYEDRDVSPQKPPLLKALAWAIRSRFASNYNSAEDAGVYDEVARYYFGREKLAYKIGLEFLQNIQKEPEDCLICDRAAGTGIITEALIEAGYKVRASDISESQLKKLSEKCPEASTAMEDINGDMEGVEDSSVDGIVEVAATRFMTPEGQENYVKEASRTLKDGGILVWPLFPTEFTAKAKHGSGWKGGSKAISALLEQNGFRIISNDILIHGLAGTFTCTLLVARKEEVLTDHSAKKRKISVL